MNAELERQVELRTQELKEQNDKIMDSINYAQRIQEAMLPSPRELEKVFGEHFVLWRPRDIVGGDFYWVRDFEHGSLVVVGDCTGHGVPGALMTMAVVSMLDQIANNITQNDPALIIRELNRLLRQNLQQDDGLKRLDDGLDAGICYIPRSGQLIFAGAKIALYQVNAEGIRVYPGARHGIGHRRRSDAQPAVNQAIDYSPGDIFYLSTDGYWHQNDAEKNHSFGLRRFRELLVEVSVLPLSEQLKVFQDRLTAYMQGEDQRDDITVLGFRMGKEIEHENQ